MTSNDSSLLKDSQKTKGTIWKPLITVSLLSVSSFTAGQYLPYVIIAVSGSGPIAAVPLAIFAVSTVVVLISTIYLVRLAVSRADNKKEAGLDKEKSGHTPSQEPQKFVCKNCTNLENKPNVPAPQSPPVTLGTQLNPSVSPPLLPPGGLLNWNLSKNNTTSENPSVGTTQKKTPPDKKYEDKKRVPVDNDAIINVRANLKKPMQLNNSIGGQQGPVKESDAVESNQCTDKKETPEEYAARLEKVREKSKQSTMENVQDHPHGLAMILSRRTAMVEYSESESEDEYENDGCTIDDEWDKEEDEYQRSLNLQQDSTKRSESPDSDYGSGSELTSSSHSAPKVDKSPIPPKPAGLQTKPEAPPALQVNEMQDPSILSVKERAKMFGNRK